MSKPKIYVFINSGRGTDWVCGMALAEDGTCLAQHVSSNASFFRHDMGLTSDWKHDNYNKHYPNGYELVELDEPRGHPELMEAYRLNQERAAQAKGSSGDE